MDKWKIAVNILFRCSSPSGRGWPLGGPVLAHMVTWTLLPYRVERGGAYLSWLWARGRVTMDTPPAHQQTETHNLSHSHSRLRSILRHRPPASLRMVGGAWGAEGTKSNIFFWWKRRYTHTHTPSNHNHTKSPVNMHVSGLWACRTWETRLKLFLNPEQLFRSCAKRCTTAPFRSSFQTSWNRKKQEHLYFSLWLVCLMSL